MRQTLLLLVILFVLTASEPGTRVVVLPTVAPPPGPYSYSDDFSGDLANFNADNSKPWTISSGVLSVTTTGNGFLRHTTSHTTPDICTCIDLTTQDTNSVGSGVFLRSGASAMSGYTIGGYRWRADGYFYVSGFNNGAWLENDAIWSTNSPPAIGDRVCMSATGGTSSTPPVLRVWKNPGTDCTGTCTAGSTGAGCTYTFNTEIGTWNSSLLSGTYSQKYAGVLAEHAAVRTCTYDDYYSTDI